MPTIESNTDVSTAMIRFRGDPKLWEEVTRQAAKDGRFMPKDQVRRLLASMPDRVVKVDDESGGTPVFESDPATKILLTYPIAQKDTPEVREALERVFLWQSHFQRMGDVIDSFGTRPSPMISTEGEAFVGVEEKPQ